MSCDDRSVMEPWDAENQLLEPQVITSGLKPPVITSPAVADCGLFLPFSDEFYWEKQCDEALSEEAGKSHSDDDDDDDFDEIMNIELFHGPTSYREHRHSGATGSPAEVANNSSTTTVVPNRTSELLGHEFSASKKEASRNRRYEQSAITATASPQEEPTTATSATESLLADSGRHYKPISASYSLFGGSSNLSMAPERLVSSSSTPPAINGIPMYRTPIARTYHNLGDGTGIGGGKATGAPGRGGLEGRRDVAYRKLDKLDRYSSATRAKYEIGIRNINKTYLNRLNVVLSLMLVICSIIGIALFLFYMLSCNE